MATQTEEPKKPIISPGSMFNSSEGLLSTGAMAALVQQMSSATDWRAQGAAAIALAAIAVGYAVVRGRCKAAS